MDASVQDLTKALDQEGALEAEEDRLSDRKGELIREQLKALGAGDDQRVTQLSKQIHSVEMRRRGVRAST